MMRLFAVALLALTLSGCIARTAYQVVTLPVKIVSRGVDAVTTSQSEADEKRGREARKADERRGREEVAALKRCQKARREAERRGEPEPYCG